MIVADNTAGNATDHGAGYNVVCPATIAGNRAKNAADRGTCDGTIARALAIGSGISRGIATGRQGQKCGRAHSSGFRHESHEGYSFCLSHLQRR